MLDAYLHVFLFRYILLFIVCVESFYLLLCHNRIYVNGVVNLRLVLFFIFCLYFVGYRQWWIEDVFGDSIRYGKAYLEFSLYKSWDFETYKEYGFWLLTYLCRWLGLSVEMFFLVCAFLYLFPLFVSSYKLSKQYPHLIILFIVTTMSFYMYAVDGIRNGISTSFLILAFVNYRNTLRFFIYSLIAFSFHYSAVWPFSFFCIAILYPKVKLYLFAWVFSVFCGFMLSGYIKNLLLIIPFLNEKAESYLTGTASLSMFSKVGFRWDFVLYSSLPIWFSSYFYFIKSYRNDFYNKLFSCYLLSNMLWVFINEVPFSNRFAYLSWFMMPLLIVYPMIDMKYFNYRYTSISIVLIGYYLFTIVL